LSTTVGLKKAKIRFYNFHVPGDRKERQLGYVSLLVKQLLRERAVELQALPGASIDSNHNLLFFQRCALD
jgi:hypothetical protein